jgi:hypothetical protein
VLKVYDRNGHLKDRAAGYPDQAVSAGFACNTGQANNDAPFIWNGKLYNTDPAAIYTSPGPTAADQIVRVRDAGFYRISYSVLTGNGSIADGRWDVVLRRIAAGTSSWTVKPMGGDLGRFENMGRTSGGYVKFNYSAPIYLGAGDGVMLTINGSNFTYADSSWSNLYIDKVASSVGVAPEPWTHVTSLLNGWTQHPGAGREKVGYRKTPDGMLHIKGEIQPGSSASWALPAFVLPLGYRPATEKRLARMIWAGATPVGHLYINTSGEVTPYSPNTASEFYLTGEGFFLDA